MTSNLYIASIEPGCGKSVVALGITELLSRHFEGVSFFRPIISDHAGRDDHIELVRARTCAERPYESLYGVSHETARQRSDAGQTDLLLQQIDRQYRELECDGEIIVCEGTDHSELASPFDFEFDAQLANRLDCRVVLVTGGRRRSAQDAADVACAAHDAFTRQGCRIAATIISRVDREFIETVEQRLAQRVAGQWPYFILPEVEMLAKPTVGQIAAAIGARPLFVDTPSDDAVVSNCRVAAMQLTHFLKFVDQGSLVITPGDRTDVILAALACRTAKTYPDISGIILTGNLDPHSDVLRLLNGCQPLGVPIYVADDDTYTTAMKVHTARPTITRSDATKVAAALETFATSIDTAAFEQAILT